tara:strand:- start:480 stop:998 length:519 start_codon:yes stop_codon:yes gene_type:complete
MKNFFLPYFVILFFVVIFVIFYKGLQDTNVYTPDKIIQYEIPMFNTKEFYSGENFSSSEIFEPEKTYLLNVWSSWCIPCRKEHHLLMGLKKEKNINIIGLNYKDNKKNAKNFLEELGNPYKKIFIDLEGTTAIELGAYGVPESFLIYNNKIIKKYIGPLNQKLIDEIKLLVE